MRFAFTVNYEYYLQAVGRGGFLEAELGEDRLVSETEAVVALLIKGAGFGAVEVAQAGQHQSDDAVGEFVHPVAAQRDFQADFVALAQFEAGDGVFGQGFDRLLAGDFA